MYKGLNKCQGKDGRDIVNLNRDDATGFRLDTLSTCKQYANPVVRGHEILATRTDFVNKYPSLLQTTSYSLSATETTPELCVGVVKAPGTFPKNPAQYAADIHMLEQKVELVSAFSSSTGKSKPVDAIRVDGAVDEGPAHEEVQYWWTARHIEKQKLAVSDYKK